MITTKVKIWTRPNFILRYKWVITLTGEKVLSDMRKNGIITIAHIRAGSKAHRFLADLGIHEGEKIRVVKNDEGPIIVEVKGTRVAIGRGLASKIEVN